MATDPSASEDGCFCAHKQPYESPDNSGFKKETYRTGGKELSGGIEEASSLFGKDFEFTWDYAVVRRMIRGVAEAAGYTLDVVLNPKSV